MKLLKLITFISNIFILSLLVSCDKHVFDTLDYCPRGVYIHIFSQTECATLPSYPNEITNVTILGFDVNDKYIGSMQIRDFNINSENKTLFPLDNYGTYSFVVWGDNDGSLFEIVQPIEGQTSKSDLFRTLKLIGDTSAINLYSKNVYVGTTPNVTVGRNNDFFGETNANLREITNRINVKIEGVDDSSVLEVKLYSDNISYSNHGMIIPWKQVKYPQIGIKYPSSSELETEFVTLMLESGRKSILEVYDTSSGKLIYNEDLIGTILMSPVAANINLRCLNDFNVKLKMKCCTDCETGYMMIALYINDWLVHSYDIDI